jgi:hypothetical protein
MGELGAVPHGIQVRTAEVLTCRSAQHVDEGLGLTELQLVRHEVDVVAFLRHSLRGPAAASGPSDEVQARVDPADVPARSLRAMALAATSPNTRFVGAAKPSGVLSFFGTARDPPATSDSRRPSHQARSVDRAVDDLVSGLDGFGMRRITRTCLDSRKGTSMAA